MNRLISPWVNSLIAVSSCLSFVSFAADDDIVATANPTQVEPLRFMIPPRRFVILNEGKPRVLGPVVVNQLVEKGPDLNHEFDQIIFLRDQTAKNARARMESDLEKAITQLDETCHLTDPQKKRLQLAGQRDLMIFFDAFEHVRKASEQRRTTNDDSNLEKRLRVRARKGIFDCDSFLAKSLPRQLQPQQFADFQEELKVRNQQMIQRIMAEIESETFHLTEPQKKIITDLVVQKPPRLFAPSDTDRQYDQTEVDATFYRVCKSYDQEMETHANDPSWSTLRFRLPTFQRLEPRLIMMGEIDHRQDEAR